MLVNEGDIQVSCLKLGDIYIDISLLFFENFLTETFNNKFKK